MFAAQEARLLADAGSAPSEGVLVLETVGAVEEFVAAVRRIPGMEWLAEIDEEDIEPDDDFAAANDDGEVVQGKLLRGRLYLVFTNQRAFEEVLSLWRRWSSGQPLPYGFAKWRDMFAHLRDVRPWGVQERFLETGVRADWEDRLAHGQEAVPCEVELWYRGNPDARAAAHQRVGALITQMGGRLLSQAVIPAIGYHALLSELPAAAVQPLLTGTVGDVMLVQCESIQFFRPVGQCAVVLPETDRLPDGVAPAAPPAAGEPTVALLDGLPLQNHQRLAGRLVVDDPDGFEALYQANERRHGTAMASLILHGELDAGEQPLARPLYVRPILRPDGRDWRNPRHEAVPSDVLLVDLVHRAVRRLFEGDAGPAVAPSVRVINLSIGDPERPFYRTLSPLARLLDWLAWRYQVLFVVSAGNCPQCIELGVTKADFEGMDMGERQSAILAAVAADNRRRRLLSPAEAVNAIAVGAVHHDQAVHPAGPHDIDPYVAPRLPSPINAQGMGYRRSVKPDVLAPGGRVVLRETPVLNESTRLEPELALRPPGQRVAAPGAVAGELGRTWHTRGTSNAAAITSRAAAELSEVLDGLREQPGGQVIDTVPDAVWMKALLVHSAYWGPAGQAVEAALAPTRARRGLGEYLTRLLGFGEVRPHTVVECTACRATALGGGILGAGQAHIHRFPLPAALGGLPGWRRLTVTLAWFTPVDPGSRVWPKANLWFQPPGEKLRVERCQADGICVLRGTVQHEVLEGERAAAFVAGDALEVQVNCRAERDVLEEQVPYALAITLEVGEDLQIEIYDEIRTRIQAAIQVIPPA